MLNLPVRLFFNKLDLYFALHAVRTFDYLGKTTLLTPENYPL
jgi:hypothetical protein